MMTVITCNAPKCAEKLTNIPLFSVLKTSQCSIRANIFTTRCDIFACFCGFSDVGLPTLLDWFVAIIAATLPSVLTPCQSHRLLLENHPVGNAF